MISALPIHIGFALCLLAGVQAHSHLANPLPTRRLDCRAGNGRPRDCYGPCPPLDTYGEPTGISPSRPAEVWRRGERRTITWHRNNHGHGESGFVRFTLVPIDKMMDKKAHEKFTFQISCWASGLHRCRSRNVHVCGNDAEGKAYQVPIEVPSAYPDGVYAFGWAWYGGGDYKGTSFFGDYYSCSFIRIQGGAAITESSEPVFVPGLNTRYNDACLAATNRVGHCSREPCHIGGMYKMTPRNLPRNIFRKDIDGKSMLPEKEETYNEEDKRDDKKTDKRGDKQNEKEEKNERNRSKRSSISIKGLQIVDIKTGRMQLVRHGSVKIKTSKYKKGFTLGLDVRGAVQKVQFRMPGRSQTEYLPPFIVNGNDGGRYSPLRCRKGKKFKLSCTVFGRGNTSTKVSYKVKCT